jgi:hypothetical protein
MRFERSAGRSGDAPKRSNLTWTAVCDKANLFWDRTNLLWETANPR